MNILFLVKITLCQEQQTEKGKSVTFNVRLNLY